MLRFEASVLSALRELAPDETLCIDGWPVAPGQRAQVVLRRFDVYAPDAKIVVIDGDRELEAPRSRTIFFMGARIDGSGRFAVGLDPDTEALHGTIPDGESLYTLLPEEDGSGRHRLAAKDAFDAEGTPLRTWKCGQEELPLEESGSSLSPAPAGLSGALAPATKIAVIAVETDNEFMNLKFGNNATNATTYIANLFIELNVIYERDVNLRLLQGYTILRPSTTADPYLQSGTGNADSAKLAEFRNYWNAQYAWDAEQGRLRRALAVMLSGKQGSNNAASGIASLNVLCGFSGYSFNQVFKFAQQTAASDVGIVAHEIGHNLASPHTHCYANPKPDTCYRLEVGTDCLSGSTACPPLATYNGVSARGTLMSYCHVTAADGGVDGCSKANVYHPDSLTRYVNGAVAAATSCVFAIGAAAPAITNVSPVSGPVAGGTSLTITGTNFASGATVAFVELPSNDVFGAPSAKPAASITFNGATQLTVTTPSASSAGAVDVVVMNPDFQTATRASGYTYSAAAAPPTVTTINPDNGSTAGGTSVTITGTGFVASPIVTIGGVAATAVTFVSPTTLTATTGAHVTGTYDVVVTNPGGLSGTIAAGYFYVPPGAGTHFFALAPCRVVETRNVPGGPQSGPALAAGEVRVFSITATGAGTCNVPDTSVAVSANVTVTGPGAAGELKVFPGNGVLPIPSVVSFTAGQTRANNAMLFLSTAVDGLGHRAIKVKNASSSTVHVIVDVNGYYQ